MRLQPGSAAARVVYTARQTSRARRDPQNPDELGADREASVAVVYAPRPRATFLMRRDISPCPRFWAFCMLVLFVFSFFQSKENTSTARVSAYLFFEKTHPKKLFSSSPDGDLQQEFFFLSNLPPDDFVSFSSPFFFQKLIFFVLFLLMSLLTHFLPPPIWGSSSRLHPPTPQHTHTHRHVPSSLHLGASRGGERARTRTHTHTHARTRLAATQPSLRYPQ